MRDTDHEKPIGQTGPIRVANSDGDPLITWLKVRFPNDKAAQEHLIAAAFVQALNARDGTRWVLEQLSESDFDFILRAGQKQQYLELQEIIIPPAKKGSPYASREQVIQSNKFATTIISEIRKKSEKYPTTLARPVDLLTYTTHWRFLPNQTVLKFIHHQKHNNHPFTRVFFFNMLDENEGRIEQLFPNDTLLQGFDPMSTNSGENRYANLDPAKAQSLKTSDGKVGGAFVLGPDAVKKLFGS